MKNLLFLLFGLAIPAFVQANVYTVNNEAGSSADFADLQQAINAAQNGDTLYVQPSSLSYATALVNKRLVITGAGHNPSFSPYNSQVTQIVLATGSDNSIIKGLNIQNVSSNPNVTINNIVFSGCFIAGNSSIITVSDGVYNNWIFEGCILNSYNTSPISFNNIDANLIVRNCYLQNYSSQVVTSNVPSGTLFDHCLIIDTGISSYFGPVSGTNITLRNNIIITFSTSNQGVNSCVACTFESNIFSPLGGSNFGSIPGSGNFVNINPQLSSFSNTGAYSYNFNLNLSAASVGNNTATDGTDVGLYGGIFNFSPIGADAGAPQIVNFSLGSSTVPQGGTLIINLNANGSGE